MSDRKCNHHTGGLRCIARASHAQGAHRMVEDTRVRDYTSNPKQYRLDDDDCALLLRARKIARLAMSDAEGAVWRELANKYNFIADTIQKGPNARLIWAVPKRKKRETNEGHPQILTTTGNSVRTAQRAS